ncbi:MAG: right-handed parallel beta-helix repeat-containing protein, partial [Gammaproteobacteria bacterium]
VYANHPVLVEGNNCADLGPGVTLVVPGTCGDYDGDGRIGAAEDTDNATDRIFGTINTALGNNLALVGAAIQATTADQNGSVRIVTSGRFRERVLITAANGNVSLEAAPGVDADIDAVVQGLAGNDVAQGNPGILVDAPAARRVTIRNIMSRNWTAGIRAVGTSHVAIDNCRLENNRDFGVHVMDQARAVITNTEVNATGFRQGAGVDNTPNPGIGIAFEDFSRGAVAVSRVTGSFAAGIRNATGNKNAIRVRELVLFENQPNQQGPLTQLPLF